MPSATPHRAEALLGTFFIVTRLSRAIPSRSFLPIG